jgi:hypothetical protein
MRNVETQIIDHELWIWIGKGTQVEEEAQNRGTLLKEKFENCTVQRIEQEKEPEEFKKIFSFQSIKYIAPISLKKQVGHR